eukprot:2067654-Rhodomonas_salina.1
MPAEHSCIGKSRQATEYATSNRSPWPYPESGTRDVSVAHSTVCAVLWSLRASHSTRSYASAELHNARACACAYKSRTSQKARGYVSMCPVPGMA